MADTTDENEFYGAQERTEEELDDHAKGFRVGAAGGANDMNQSVAWQRGWADAQGW